ncbi:MAG: hypothetical protein LBP55_06165 [Candidatus Adiutrix sp.]|jgi:hypothetical protein|nr:hypothetical protein [Candidatus Adiutrix sp.]
MLNENLSEKQLSVDQEKLNNFLVLIVKLAEQYGSSFNIEHLSELVMIASEHDAHLREGTSDPENFLTISQMESMMLDLERRIKEADLKSLLEELKHLKGEDAIVDKKKPHGEKEM